MPSASFIIGLVVIATTASAPADPKQEVEVAVRTLEDAFSKGDTEIVRSMMTADHLGVTTYATLSGIDELLGALPHYQISDRQISGIEVRTVTDDVAVAHYRAVIKGTYKGAELPRQVWVVAVWVKKDGKWREATYQETPNLRANKK